MALTPAELLRQQALDLDYDDIKELLTNAGLKGDIETLTLDWSQKQININSLAISSTGTEIQVATNKVDIETNAINIGTNATNIGTNTTNITANTDAIALASGQLVGNNDFATAGIGGVVNLAANVSDAIQSSVVVTSPDATVAPAVYDQTDAQTAVTLVNELKADLTQAITDFNAVTAKLNAFLLANQNANQMAP